MQNNKHISDVVKKIPPSGIRKFFDIVYSTPDCISLGVGEPDFVTPWRISDSGIYAIKDGYTHYTSNKGLLELRTIISENLKEETEVTYSPDEEILITVGVSQALDLALRTLINPGDEVIIVEPCYVSYSSNVELAYGVPVSLPTYKEDNFQINIDRLKKLITDKTRAILLNYPSNPTGSTIEFEILKEIAQIAMEKDIIVISDEIYANISYDHEHKSIISIPGMKDYTIYLNGFSKSHAMTGWRLGYAAAPKEILAGMLKIHQYTALCAPSIAQYAAVEAIENGMFDVTKMRDEYLRRRNYITKRFNEIGLPCLKPSGAFYVFPDITSTGLGGEDFAMRLLKEQKVAVVPGEAFGQCGAGHIRSAYATSIENIKEAMNRIEKFVGNL